MKAMPWRTGVGRSGSIPDSPPESTAPIEREGELSARIILREHLAVPRGDPEPSVAGALVVLPHRQRRALQRPRLFLLQRAALEPLRHLGSDHLEDVAAQHAQRLRVVVRGQLDQVGLSGGALLVGDRELTRPGQALQGCHDRARLGDVDPALAPSPRTARSWCSSFSASRRSARASRRTCRVSVASQSAALPAPESTVASDCSASAATAAGAPRSEPHPARASPTRTASRLGVIDISGTPASESSRAVSRSAKSTTGCGRSTDWLLLMGEFKQ